MLIIIGNVLNTVARELLISAANCIYNKLKSHNTPVTSMM